MHSCRLTLALVILAAVSACTVPHRAGPSAQYAGTPAPAARSAISDKVAQFQAESDSLTAKVAEDQQALEQLRAQRSDLSKTYFDDVSGINTRLQAGTTPGNPELIASWQQAQTALTNLDDSVNKLSDLQAKIAGDSAEASYLANSVRAAFSLEGALESDHARLAEIQTKASSNGVVLDRLLAEIADDVNRQTEALAVAHRNLPNLLHAVEIGELVGAGGAPVAEAEPAPVRHAARPAAEKTAAAESAEASAEAAPQRAPRTAGKPQIVVAAEQSPAQYEPALYKVIAAAMKRSRSGGVRVVAVLPGQGPPTSRALATEAVRHKAEAVARALVSFGVAKDRVTTTATQGADMRSGEVRVYTD